MCVDGDIFCAAIEAFRNSWDQVVATYSYTVDALALAWTRLQPHLQWIGPLFGIAMAAWRWWDRREAVVWRRAMRLLSDQGKYVQNCCQRSLAAILYPGPAVPVERPTLRFRLSAAYLPEDGGVPCVCLALSDGPRICLRERTSSSTTKTIQ
jgi:hypothetical protein